MPDSGKAAGVAVNEAEEERKRRECFERWQAAQPECDRHVRNLLGMFGTEARRQYPDRIPDQSMRERVKAEFLKRWEKR